MTKLKKISAVAILTICVNTNAGNYDIAGSLSDISNVKGAAKNSLNGLMNGFLGSDFYSNLQLDSDFFNKMKDGYDAAVDGYNTVNQLLGALGITGNINCFVDLKTYKIPAINLDKICKVASEDLEEKVNGLDWSKQLSGKFTIPGIGTIGCEAEASFNPAAEIDICALSKKAFTVLRDPTDPSSGDLLGGGIIINPQRSLSGNALSDSMLRTGSNVVEQSTPALTFYKSGASVEDTNNALDVDNIFADERSANSPIAEAIARDQPEIYALLKDYVKSDEAKNNAKDPEVGDDWDEKPTEEQITKEVVKARADYFGLPKTNKDVEESISAMTHMLSDQFPYSDFSKSLEIYLGVEYGKINEDTSVTSVPQAKAEETNVFNKFMKGGVQVESKSAIEAMDAYTFTAIEKVASSTGRLTAPTQQRLDKLPSNKKLAYIALANKQYTRDALIASISARITKFKQRIFDLRVEKTRVCSSRFYDNVADSELNKIINSADALVY